MSYVVNQNVLRKTTDEIREIMEDRLKIDETLSHLDESFHELQGVPVYVPFSWNCTIIRHTFQKGCCMEMILDQYKVAIENLFKSLKIKNPPAYQITKKKRSNVFLIQIEKISEDQQK